jgi:hypothetical protein
MYNEYDAEFLTTLTVTEFKALKRAVAVLMRVGISRAVAVSTVCESLRNYRRHAA